MARMSFKTLLLRACLGGACVLVLLLFVGYFDEEDPRGSAPPSIPDEAAYPELVVHKAPAEVAAEPSPISRREIRVVDIFTRKTVANVSLVLTLDPGAGDPPRHETVASSAAGTIQVGPGRILSIQSARPAWRVAEFHADAERLGDGDTIFVCRILEIQGRIVFEGLEAGQPLPPATLDWRRLLLPEKDPNSLEVGSTAWLIRHGLQRGRKEEILATDDAGRFRGTVPLLAGLHLAAHSRGWRSAALSLDREAQALAAAGRDFTLVLRRANAISGRLLDSKGRPLGGQLVHLYLLVEKTATDEDHTEADTQDEGLVIRITDKATGESRLSVTHTVRTTDDGRFTFDVPLGARFRATVMVTVPRYMPMRSSLGSMSGPIQDVELQATEWSGGAPHVKVMRAGKPVSKGLVTITLNEPGFSHTVSVEPSGDGTIDASALERGRHYTISVFGDLPKTPGRGARKIIDFGHLTWDGRTVVEIDDLAKRYTAPR